MQSRCENCLSISQDVFPTSAAWLLDVLHKAGSFGLGPEQQILIVVFVEVVLSFTPTVTHYLSLHGPVSILLLLIFILILFLFIVAGSVIVLFIVDGGVVVLKA